VQEITLDKVLFLNKFGEDNKKGGDGPGETSKDDLVKEGMSHSEREATRVNVKQGRIAMLKLYLTALKVRVFNSEFRINTGCSQWFSTLTIDCQGHVEC